MNRLTSTISATTLCLILAGPALAKDVHLQVGETFQQGDLTVTCGQQGLQPLAVKDCQHWDSYDEKCLFERTTYSHEQVQCVEECQHWDSYSKKCAYQTTCTFYPAQQAFVRSECEDFDTFRGVCVKKKDVRVGGK